MRSFLLNPKEFEGKWCDLSYKGRSVGRAMVRANGQIIAVIEDDSLKDLVKPQNISFSINAEERVE